jgi:hypothetical protein
MVSVRDGGKMEAIALILAVPVVLIVWLLVSDLKRRRRGRITGHNVDAAVRQARIEAEGRIFHDPSSGP